MKRADTLEDKEIRKGELQAAYLRLLKKYPSAEINFSKIAEETGWSRGNIYRYYRNVQEIAFDTFSHDLEKLLTGFRDLLLRFKGEDPRLVAKGLADLITDDMMACHHANHYWTSERIMIRPELATEIEERIARIDSDVCAAIAECLDLSAAESESVYRGIGSFFAGFVASLQKWGFDMPRGEFESEEKRQEITEFLARWFYAFLTFRD